MDNKALIQQFYEAFREKDFVTMQKFYHDEAVFNDEAFINLNAEQVRAMWEMLIKRGKDLVLIYQNIEANENTGRAEWIATYTFTKTGRKVTNHIFAEFSFKDGKIYRHTDKFNFYKWSKQALGLVGLLLGWTTFLRKKVQKTAQEQLNKYMEKK